MRRNSTACKLSMPTCSFRLSDSPSSPSHPVTCLLQSSCCGCGYRERLFAQKGTGYVTTQQTRPMLIVKRFSREKLRFSTFGPVLRRERLRIAYRSLERNRSSHPALGIPDACVRTAFGGIISPSGQHLQNWQTPKNGPRDLRSWSFLFPEKSHFLEKSNFRRRQNSSVVCRDLDGSCKCVLEEEEEEGDSESFAAQNWLAQRLKNTTFPAKVFFCHKYRYWKTNPVDDRHTNKESKALTWRAASKRTSTVSARLSTGATPAPLLPPPSASALIKDDSSGEPPEGNTEAYLWRGE